VKGEVNPEMDSIKKLVSGRLQAAPAGPHPDADVLSAFAENALSPGERARVLAHLADCGECRQILFLSLPQPAATQKVLTPSPRPWHFALRWAAVAASVVVVGGVIAVRHELLRKPMQVATTGPMVDSYAKSKVAEETVPPEVDNMRQAQGVNEIASHPGKKVSPVPERVRPDLKHMTAKMQASLAFGKSDQVSVSPPVRPAVVAEFSQKTAIQSATAGANASPEMPIQGRDALDLKDLSANQPAAAPPPVPLVGNDKSDAASVRTGALAKQADAKPHFEGTVFDASGAVVPNAKVTTVGPIGTETVTVDAQGRFAFDVPAPGLYSVKAEATGFKPAELQQVAVAATTPSLELKLLPGAMAETVEVQAQAAAALESTSTGYVVGGVPQRKETRKMRRKAASVGGPAGGLMVPTLQWTLSPDGAVQNSNDGGKTWQAVPVADHAGFRALSAVGLSVWVGGSAGSLYHSVDAGQHWTAITPALNGQKLQSDITRIEFVDSGNGSVTTSNGETWTTHDAGNNWERK
jgi:carboxypeptidase family protein/photosynthesis system II assembly factor YCF48-like protein/putative zinc finger protein